MCPQAISYIAQPGPKAASSAATTYLSNTWRHTIAGIVGTMAQAMSAQWSRQCRHNDSLQPHTGATPNVPSEKHIIAGTQYCVGAGTMAQWHTFTPPLRRSHSLNYSPLSRSHLLREKVFHFSTKAGCRSGLTKPIAKFKCTPWLVSSPGCYTACVRRVSVIHFLSQLTSFLKAFL